MEKPVAILTLRWTRAVVHHERLFGCFEAILNSSCLSRDSPLCAALSSSTRQRCVEDVFGAFRVGEARMLCGKL